MADTMKTAEIAIKYVSTSKMIVDLLSKVIPKHFSFVMIIYAIKIDNSLSKCS